MYTVAFKLLKIILTLLFYLRMGTIITWAGVSYICSNLMLEEIFWSQI